MENKGYIYILTNPSFKEYVKIGYADNVENRLKQLNNSECIPFAFRVYATYEVEDRLTDVKLHGLIDQLNPNLRSIDNINGKKRVREFYAMSPEQAYSILETIAILGGRKERLKLWELSVEEQKEEEIAQEIKEEHIERLSPFTFSKCEIPIGEKITFVCRGNEHSGEECMVVSEKLIEYKGKRYSLSALATEFTKSKHGVAGPRYFKYKGEWLNVIRARKEGWSVSSRLENVWIIPCNPKLYDIEGAFNKFETIDWRQTHNASIGDIVYIYVGGQYKSIMYKCEVIGTDIIIDKAEECKDMEFYRELEVENDYTYMKIKLLERYNKSLYPLDELKENGLTSVQGRSKVSMQLLKYLEKKQ